MFEKQRNNKVESSSPQEPSLSVATPEVVASAPTPKRGNALIGSSIVIKGDVSGEEDLVIEGRVDGSVTFSDNEVTVGKSGHVRANVAAKKINIDGEVEGDIVGNEKVVITRSGKVQGNIVAPRVTLEDGAKFKGSIDMDPSGTGAARSSTQPKPAKRAAVDKQDTDEPGTAGATTGS
ncbi:MAG TPA: polymer-forming cytoskeletal protein [Porticoccaceae bacterium]|jgi:cytoskeletal protein CcmA (bactofilin family)|nr:polymer-forming cytoskeletal protein [Porticoccaceae bacterium]